MSARRLSLCGALAGAWLLGLTAARAVDDPKEMLADPQLEARAEQIGSQLRCLVCQNESIEDSQAPLAHDLRQIVRQHVARGEDEKQIVAWMVARYGNFVRLSPPLNATTALLWATPVLGLLLGGTAAALARRRRTAAPAPLSAEEQARLDALTRAS